MQTYLQSAAHVLADPSSNEIYCAWENHEPGVVDRMNWFNKHARTPVFGPACFTNHTSANVVPAPPTRAQISTTCRWCAQPFDMPCSALYKCKCGGWAGHRACGEAFAREYSQKCPICAHRSSHATNPPNICSGAWNPNTDGNHPYTQPEPATTKMPIDLTSVYKTLGKCNPPTMLRKSSTPFWIRQTRTAPSNLWPSWA